MTISTFGVGAAVTPTVVKTYVSHYANRKPRHQKPTAHISYDEGLHLIQSFLGYASQHTVEDLQAFTAQWVPCPSWIRTEDVPIPAECITRAADTIIENLGPHGIDQVGGAKWWQWRKQNTELKAEWVEMRSHYNARVKAKTKCKRVMLYIHGGAYFFGSVDEHRYQMQRHARKLQARVFAPRYRLAPQFPFPCGLHDCLSSYLFLLTLQDPSEIIVAGDSAGAGMVVSMLCLLRDQGLPLPAGGILISPWVDLTHSFPSLAGDGAFDYIPAHGFMQRPSASWPPPNDDEMEVITTGAIAKSAGQSVPGIVSGRKQRKSLEQEAIDGFAEVNAAHQAEAQAATNPDNPAQTNDSHMRGGSTMPGGKHLSIEIDGKLVILKDQIQMYATNQLISHPLVSPVLQPSLGGLPPLLIQVGGGELLRDEQIYLAHKAAHPHKYPLGPAYRQRYDPDDKILNKYKPTPVQLQVWEDLCHVAPTLSFTRPAKYMYRAIAQFGAWALARAQKTSIEMVDDDNISIISDSDSDSEHPSMSNDSIDNQKKSIPVPATKIGRAGDPVPHFKNGMIRQKVDRHGDVYSLPPASELPALQLDTSEIGSIKPGPVRKWMAAKTQWDTKYAKDKRKVQKTRIKQLIQSDGVGFGAGEHPPPSALAGRIHDKEVMRKTKLKRSYGLGMWSLWGSKHDETTMKREEEVVKRDEKENIDIPTIQDIDTVDTVDSRVETEMSTKYRRLSRSRASNDEQNFARIESRRRTVSISDQGQADNEKVLHPDADDGGDNDQSQSERPVAATNDYLSPAFVPKFKTAAHLRDASASASDNISTRTGYSQNTVGDNASTKGIFSSSGVTQEQPLSSSSNNTGTDTPDSDGMDSMGIGKHSPIYKSEHDTFGGAESPSSRRSIERLQSHQGDHESTSEGLLGTPTMQPMRTSSSRAIVQAEGVVGIVEGGNADNDARSHQDMGTTERPGMYNRKNTEFKTAMERL